MRTGSPPFTRYVIEVTPSGSSTRPSTFTSGCVSPGAPKSIGEPSQTRPLPPKMVNIGPSVRPGSVIAIGSVFDQK